MILKKLVLNPFAGTSDGTYEFNPGINIFLGRNEAGKSTMVKSILAVLFIKPSKLVKDRNQFECFFPVGGGDTIKAQLDFSINGDDYNISKSWGAANKSEMRLPGGILLSKYDEIEKRINDFLGLTKVTYENVLFVNQSKLTTTISDINKSDVKNDLTQILRSAIFETGGVSVEKFRELLNKKEKLYFDSWNKNSDKPKGNKDIDSPWINNVGFILKAYYKYRNLEKEYREIIEYGIKIDDYNKRINELTIKRNELEDFLNNNKKSYEDNSKRELLETKIKTISEKVNEITQAQILLPKLQSETEYLSREYEDLKEKIGILEEEKKKAIEVEGKKHLAEKYLKIEKLYSGLENEKKKLNDFIKVTAGDLKKCNKIHQKTESYRNKLEAQKLNASITAKSSVSGEVTLGADKKPVALNSGEEFNDSAKGKFIFENESLKIEVSSGNEDVDEILDNLSKTEKEFVELLDSFKAKSIEELSESEEKYRLQLTEVENIGKRIKDELEEHTFEELKEIYENVKSVKITKSSNEISDEIAVINKKSGKTEEQIKTNNKQIKNYEDKYGSADSLLGKLVDLKTEENSINKDLSELSPLPEGFTGPSEFIRHYDNTKNDFDDVKDELHNLSMEKKEFEKKEPENTEKEICEDLEEAKKEFTGKKEEGEAILLIKSEVEETLSSLDSDTYKPLKDSLKKYLAASFNTENSDLKLDELNIKSLIRDGKELPIELLSTGTRDIIGLAVRLAMAEYYLKEKEGFMIMDDPLVNLDPGRQTTAVSLIKEFAKAKQIIIMTCQPAHAALFGENIINL